MMYEGDRETLVALSKALSQKGYLAGTGGNIMMRLSQTEVAVTPSAKDYHSLTSDNICVLSLKDLRLLEGNCQPSVESSMHAVILRKRPDVCISIHTHQPVASACTLLDSNLSVPPSMQASLGECVPMISYAPSGTGVLVSKVRKAIRADSNAYLLRNHGVICIGKTQDEAVHALDHLEQLAREYLSEKMSIAEVAATSFDANVETLCRCLNEMASLEGSK